MSRIGVFICWCGENIARTVDVAKVTEACGALPGVRCAAHYKYMCSDPGQQAVIDQLTRVLFIQAVRTCFTAVPDWGGTWLAAITDPEIGRALQLMHSRLDAPWTVAALADAVCLSRSVFASRFKALVSQSPLQYLLEYRMQKAAELLLEDRCGIKEIPAQVGYATRAAFSNAFKRWSGGTSPGTYKRLHQTSAGHNVPRW